MFGYEMFFAGQKAAHGFELYHHLSLLINANPQIRSIVELGSSKGAMSIYLGLWGARMGIPVHTFDLEPKPLMVNDGILGTAEPIFKKLGIQGHWVDFTTPEGHRQVVESVGTLPTLLYVDGGNKTNEFNTFVPLTAKDSVICVHDFFNDPVVGEIKSTDVEHTVQAHGLKLEPWESSKWSSLALGMWIKR